MPVQSLASSSRRSLTPHPSFGADEVEGQSFNTSIRSESSFDADDDANHVPRNVPNPYPAYLRFPLRRYLNECGLPFFVYRGKDSLMEEKQMRSAMRWPDIHSLRVKPHAPRNLKFVKRLMKYTDMTHEITTYFSQINKEEMCNHPSTEYEFRAAFRLPCKDIVHFEESDVNALSDIQNETEVVTLLNRYVFDTVLAVISVMHRFNPEDPNDRPLIEKFRFRIANSLLFDRYAKWDIFTLPCPNEFTIPLIVIFIHPCHFGVEDFERLVEQRAIPEGSLEAPKDPSDIIWAVLYEILKGRGRRFVVTNYVRWAFGLFDPLYTSAAITDIYESKLVDIFGKPTHVPQRQVCNPIELLVRWMTAVPEKEATYDHNYQRHIIH
ncbi:hypothetical protein GALMADRAFT_127888 [Galerina marginata CBS 339.88]|uniref:Uncharacterized protein n=1 Tax=Galerina marginata (strain CBS 339.88) TaxID=685588 RepID=A0A067SH02_GALM3|nr:hypothetical protein GALMADRAFT_127888 [Galerina marginata CBS 339.88]